MIFELIMIDCHSHLADHQFEQVSLVYGESVVLYICMFYSGCLLISESSPLSVAVFPRIRPPTLCFMLLIWFSKLLQILNKDLGLMTRQRLFK